MTDADLLNRLNSCLRSHSYRDVDEKLSRFRDQIAKQMSNGVSSRDSGRTDDEYDTPSAITSEVMPIVRAALKAKKRRFGSAALTLLLMILPDLLPILIDALRYLMSRRPAVAAGMLNPDDIDADIVSAAMASEVVG